MNASRTSRTPVARGFSPASMALVISSLLIGAGHAQPPAQRAPGPVEAGVTAVLVDVVVRDKRGEPVRDLKPSDFQVIEDGAPQTIGSFTPVFDGEMVATASTAQPAAGAGSAGGTVGSPPPLNPGPAVTALVFDRLSPEARRLAVEAARSSPGWTASRAR